MHDHWNCMQAAQIYLPANWAHFIDDVHVMHLERHS